jgi:hypothetical protein
VDIEERHLDGEEDGATDGTVDGISDGIMENVGLDDSDGAYEGIFVGTTDSDGSALETDGASEGIVEGLVVEGTVEGLVVDKHVGPMQQ